MLAGHGPPIWCDMKRVFPHCLYLALLFLALPVAGISQPDIPGSSDHEALSRFAESWIVDYRSQDRINYLLVLGMMRRAGGRVVPENAVRLHGRVTRITYELAPSFAGADAWQFFLQQMESRQYRQLFACSGRECGNSNYWANDVFGMRTLYGSERSQFYLAAEIGSENSDRYLALYVVTRPNQRSYAHLEVIEVDSSTVSQAVSGVTRNLQTLLQEGSLRLDPVVFDDQDLLQDGAGLQMVVDLLAENPDLDLYVVAHLRQPGAFRALVQRSQLRAEAVRNALIELGVPGDRLMAEGAGPLAPRCTEGGCDERVEVVLQQ